MSSPSKLVVITGAADGIGWSTAQCLADSGWKIALIDLNSQLVSDRAKFLNNGSTGWVCDVTNEEMVKNCVRDIHNQYGRIDALVNNAGIGDQTLPTLNQSIDAFDRVLAVHIKGTFLLSKQVIGYMKSQEPDHRGNRGSIVNIGSIASFSGIPGRNAYCAAKSGVIGLTRALASEWARQGIRVNAVAPGYVKTALIAKLAQEKAIDESAISHRTPLGRMADPEEIAHSISFLVSPNASYITGAVLPVDGGWNAFGAPEVALAGIEN